MSHFSKTAKPLEGTFAWVLEHKSYKMWLNSPSASILHIFGKPGSGKSLLSQFLFQKTISTLQWTPCAYFNCSVTENRRSSLQLYASLLHQLFLAFPRLLRWVSQTLQDEINYEPEDDDAGLQGILEQSIVWLQGKSNILLVVDGLDECDTGRYEVINLFRRVQKDAPWCRILLTSRHDESLLSDLGNESIRLNLDKEPGLQRDIGALIGFEVQLLVRDQPFLGPLAKEIQKILEERADGMFLLVRLIIFDLRNRKGSSSSKLGSSPAEVRKILKSLPKSLWQAYAKMLDRVSYDEQNLAKRILSCVLYSARPLTVEELSIALAVSDDIRSINELEEEISLSVLHDIHHVFGPLLQVEDGYITFMHASVRDFLLSSSGTTLSAGGNKSSLLQGLRTLFKARPWYSILKTEGNAVLLDICFNYLDLVSYTLTDYTSITTDMFRDEAPGNDDDFSMAWLRPTRSNQQLLHTKALKLLSYTAENMDEHCREISSSDSYTRLKIRTYFTSRSIDFWIVLYWIFRDRERMQQHLGPLHMACLLGLELTVEDLLKNGWNWKTPTKGELYGHFTTPLEVAVEGGDSGTVKMLLKHGASLDWHYKENRSILSTAAWYGHNEIIGILLEHGAKLVGPMELEYTALDAAVEAGRESTTLYLIDCAKKAGKSSWTSGYPVHTAVRAGRTRILQLLLEKKFPIDVHDNTGFLPFHLAASRNDVTILKLCKPSDIDHESDSGQTALEIAAKHVNKANLEYLLDNGSAINLSTALLLAIDASSSESHKKVCDVMKFLLSRGATVSQYSIDKAVTIDNAPALELLLARGAETTLDRNMDWTRSLLHLIIKSRATACLVLVLDEFTPEEMETVVKHPDGEGRTALHIAAQNPHQPIVERLLKEGVSVNAVDPKGKTPLHLILEHEIPNWRKPPLSVIETLLNHGADPSVKSNNGVSAIGSYIASHDATDAATEANHHHVWTVNELAVIELLLSRGANLTFDDFMVSTKQGLLVRSAYWSMVTMRSESVHNHTKRFLADYKLTEDQQRQGLVWALSNDNERLVNMLSPALPEWIFEEELGIQLMTAMWRVSPRTIDMILGYSAFDLTKAYKTRDQRSPTYLLCEAAERGLKRVVAKLLEIPPDSPKSASLEVLKKAARLAMMESHREVTAMIKEYVARRVDGL
ncbi:ankyrin [Melanomma pulvis-pyrius CBS 109.77]|uniref:Ankyrin n=1 Tax=Melanomma pulvis-pyrius CBS 109.77 TaxID=1314802 RepID=A0A6A6X9K0_9PLEO|nr:ankyrin [Melanomma pulvis-pyrius CBS 109.77]